MNINHIKYTWAHKKAFLKVEKQLLGHNTLGGYLHDVDKLFLYLLPISGMKVHKIHRKYSKHHVGTVRKHKAYIQMIVDWESARFTKIDKQLNAYETLIQYYPKIKDEVLPYMKQLNLIPKEAI